MVATDNPIGFGRRVARNRKKLIVVSLLSLGIWAALYPQRFVALWFTADQQGRMLFELGYYSAAAQKFENPLWKGLSLYGSEEFEPAATLFSQYPDENGLLAQGNALAHSRNYIDAMRIYQQLFALNPNSQAATTNISIVQARIDENQLMSESQQAEFGELSVNDKKGPRSSEGDERTLFDAAPKEQLSADQLLQDPGLTEMWMRQVQRDPSQFLRIKFYMQLEQLEQQASPQATGSGSGSRSGTSSQ